MARVSLKNVSKVYPGGVQALEPSSLEIEDRKFMVLVGPSGCGKSTTLRMIAGLEDVTAGTIEIGDRIVNDVPPKDRDIAMVFQDYALYPHMSVYENMSFGLSLRKFPKREIDSRVREAARSLGIDELLDRKPRALSGGQRQRVALGRAIVRQPAAFLLDEPLSNLDAKMRIAMRKEINLLHARLRATMIYVTHDQVEAMTLGERICVMNHGRIEQVGAPLDVYDRPVTEFVAGFIGTPPMNFFRGEVREEGGESFFRAEGIEIRLDRRLGDAVRGGANGPAFTFGIRPESLTIVDGPDRGSAGGPIVEARVELVEKLGNEQLVYCRSGEADYVAKADSHKALETGGTVALRMNLDAAHIFEPEGGRNITLNGGAS
jgi:multiple sugar transport system ATP-binding protein